ncbi:Protein TIPIN like protein [Habropoda laboriosa]|uniref:TIMELESS-interacting protein n=1 Tax=Habropoda laboriosa TaxID=597456 RepID=A0A0L7RCE3_9HYME|nr:PREDICTED: TIMELESS-interacting protein [Habropoda laboriosa]KOC68406.1 Protein TIPIN like protein [Habropoda laboriosa]
MSTLSNTSDCEDDEHDIIAEYENRESDGDQGNIQRNEGSDSEDQEGEEKNAKRRIDPSTSKTHIVRNPVPKLNTERLKGPKGIHTIEKYFEGFKFHGKGHEKMDLDRIMKRLEHWGHRLFPKLDFDDFLEKLEKLGNKKDLQVFITRYRLDMINNDSDVTDQDIIDAEEDKEQDEPFDEFDKLIAEQIEKQKHIIQKSSISDTSQNNNEAFDKLLSQCNVKNSQSVNTTSTSSQLSDEVKERIERNRQQAVQRRLARLKEVQEEAKRKKLEETESMQQENNKTQNIQNEKSEDNSQNLDTILKH